MGCWFSVRIQIDLPVYLSIIPPTAPPHQPATVPTAFTVGYQPKANHPQLRQRDFSLFTLHIHLPSMIKKLENRKWKVLESKKLLSKGTWMNLRQDKVQLPSGAIVPEWFVLEFPEWINIIAITKDGDFVMEDQYRHALGETHYELPAGVVDECETPLEAAKRELSEETGYGGGEWSLFMITSPNPTNHTNRSYTFLAVGVEKLSEQH